VTYLGVRLRSRGLGGAAGASDLLLDTLRGNLSLGAGKVANHSMSGAESIGELPQNDSTGGPIGDESVGINGGLLKPLLVLEKGDDVRRS
jgi:hypothetical protein